MIRALLADDEAVILRGLKRLIAWKKMGIEIIGEASDGEEALLLIRELKPELVVSDIAMPKLNGLEMLQAIAKDGLETKVIFVSGYQEFSYAKDAVRYGAVDYLLKPVEKEELEMAVHKAMDQIDSRSRLSILETTKSEDKAHEIFQKISGGNSYAKEDLYQQFSSLNLSVRGKRLVGAAFRLYLVKGSADNTKMQELLKFAAYNRLQKSLEESGWGFLIKKDLNSCYAILILEENDGRAQIEARINALACGATDRQKVIIKMGVGEIVDDISALLLAYKTARFALELYYFTEEEVIWYEDVQREFQASFEDYKAQTQRIMRAFLGEKMDMQREIQNLLGIVRNLHFGNRFAAVNRLNLFVLELTQTLCDNYVLDDFWIQEGENCMEQIRLSPTFHQSEQILTVYLERIKAQVLGGGSGEHNEWVRLKRYIEEHFRENLTLESMAHMIGMNSFYFSSYFKKQTGMNFKSYLTDVRMQEAVRLLRHTDYKSYEIAQQLGYKNVRQFNENFKGRYGKSPNEYRKDEN